MKVAFILDHEPLMRSFKWESGQAIDLDGNPYSPSFGIRNVFNVPKPFNGYFIAYNQGLVNEDFDVVFLSIEKGGASVHDIRKAYPNARVFSMIKEKNPTWHLPQSRIDFFNQCDACLVPYREHVLSFLREHVKVPVHQFMYPYERSELCAAPMPFDDRPEEIMVGCNTRRGFDASLAFARRAEEILGMKISTVNSGSLSWEEWLLKLGKTKICINLDNKPEIGQLPIECACTGTLHIGGIADAAETLWPETFGNDQEALLSQIRAFVADHSRLIANAQATLDSVYSYEASRKRLNDIITS